MLQRKPSENLYAQQIEQYEIKSEDFESKLQRIHNIVARYINVLLREINSEDITERAFLFIGKGDNDGQEHILMDFIYQLNKMIESQCELNQNNLDFLRRLITNISEIHDIHPNTIKDCVKYINLAQKDLNLQQSRTLGMRTFRTISKS
jgi:hypothetical protein